MADDKDGSSGGAFQYFLREIFTNPVNVALLGVCGYFLYKIYASRRRYNEFIAPPQKPALPPLKKQDMTLAQIRDYNGEGLHDGRILLAVNGKVFDVTRGKDFYGAGGPYSKFAGRDASRGLGLFSVSEDVVKDDYDDLSDLTSDQMSQIREWEQQFQERYEYVGKLLRPGEKPTDYTDTEDEHGSEHAKDD